MTNQWISPIDQMRTPNGILDRLTALEAALAQQSASNSQAQNLSEVSTDTWALNTSFPYAAMGRLTVVSGNPAPAFSPVSGGVLYFTPFRGNLLGIYNGSIWNTLPFAEFGIAVNGTYTGATINGQPTVTGLADTSQFIVGMQVAGTGIPVPAFIQSVDSLTQITLTANATASGSPSLQIQLLLNSDFDVFAIGTNNNQFAIRLTAWNAKSNGTVTGITNASPPVVTATAHGLTSGDVVLLPFVSGFGVAGPYRITVLTANTFSLQDYATGANSSAIGVGTGGKWYKVNQTVTRAQALGMQDGVYVLASDPTWRYLGSIHTYNGGGSILWNGNSISVWNYYNRIPLGLQSSDAVGGNWTVTTAAGWEPDHNSYANRIEFIVGVDEDAVGVNKYTTAQTSASISQFSAGISIDAVTTPLEIGTVRGGTASITGTITYGYQGRPGVGYHYFQPMEQSVTNTTTVIGGSSYILTGVLWG